MKIISSLLSNIYINVILGWRSKEVERDYGDDDDDERTGNSQSCPAGRPKPVQKVGKINK